MSTTHGDTNEISKLNLEKKTPPAPLTPSLLQLDTSPAMQAEHNEPDLLSSTDVSTASTNKCVEGKRTSTANAARKLPIHRAATAKPFSPSSARSTAGKSPNSSIPLPVRASKSPSQGPDSRSSSARSSNPSTRVTHINKCNKHTLEVQFLNKKKRLDMLKKELIEKQRPILELYNSMVLIKKKLEEFGKIVQLEEVKVIPAGEEVKKECEITEGSGEMVPVSNVDIENMKTTLEDIPKTLVTICQNLLTRRAAIVELLESVIKSEVDVSELSNKIDTFISEGNELEKSLNAIVVNHEHKINDLVLEWQSLLNSKKIETDNSRIEELQQKLNEKEASIKELQRKVADKKDLHDNAMSEMHGVIYELEDKIAKLEQELDGEKKTLSDQKTKSSTNAQTIKSMKNKITDLESKGKDYEEKNSELNKKLKHAQDQLKTKETQWQKEKEELSKNLKSQEIIVQKLTHDRNSLETRCTRVEEDTQEKEAELKSNISSLEIELNTMRGQLNKISNERDDIKGKFDDMQEHMRKMGIENKQEMNLVAQKMEWGKTMNGARPEQESELYANLLAYQVQVRQLEDKIKQLEKEKQHYLMENNAEANSRDQAESDAQILKHAEYIARYQQLLEQCEEKLQEKSRELNTLVTEVRHLKMRQDALEDQNCNCSTKDLQQMIDDGRAKLNELMRKSVENEQSISKYEGVIDKQKKHIIEMENLMRYKESMTGILKNNRDELVLDRESLLKYSQEIRTVLVEVSREGKMKERIIKELQEKLDLRERQITKLEKEVKELEANLAMTNEKRFKLQDTLSTLEKELQSTKALSNQISDMKTRYDIVGRHHSTNFLTATEVSSSSSFLSIFNAFKSDEDQSIEGANLHTDVNAVSLIEISMKRVSVLRNRLQQLTRMNLVFESELFADIPTASNNIVSTSQSDARSCSTQTLTVSPKASGYKINYLINTIKQYEQLQLQSTRCYEELCDFLKMSEQ